MLFFVRFYQSFSFSFSSLRLFYFLPLLIILFITSNAFSGDASPNIEPYLAGCYKMHYGASSKGYTCTVSSLKEGNTCYFVCVPNQRRAL